MEQEEKNKHSDRDGETDRKDYDRGYDRGHSDREESDRGRSDYSDGTTKSSNDAGVLSSPQPWGNPWDKDNESDSDKD